TTVLSYRWPRTRITRTSPKAGGIGNPVQYFIRDRAIVDWFIQWALYGEGATDEEKKAAEKLMSDLGAKGDIPQSKGCHPANERVTSRKAKGDTPVAKGDMVSPEPVIVTSNENRSEEPEIEPATTTATPRGHVGVVDDFSQERSLQQNMA